MGNGCNVWNQNKVMGIEIKEEENMDLCKKRVCRVFSVCVVRCCVQFEFFNGFECMYEFVHGFMIFRGFFEWISVFCDV